jgi:hypothetical protein
MPRIAIALMIVAACVMAGEVSGKWSGQFTGEEGVAMPLYMILTQDGNKLTGSGGPNESEQHPMQNGKIEGDRLTFEVPAGKGTFVFDLKITGDEAKGNVQLKGENETRSAKVTLKRAPG